MSERGKKVIYAVLKKSLYGSLVSSLLFWKDLTKFFEGLGFKANPYEQCVMNKTVKGKQLTVCWYVDDIKMLHVDKSTLEWLVSELKDRYGGVSPLTRSSNGRRSAACSLGTRLPGMICGGRDRVGPAP